MDLKDLGGDFCLAAPAVSYRSRLPAELALQHNPAETKDGSVGFPYINTVLNIKLGALIRTLSWLHSSLITPDPTSFSLPAHTHFQVNQFVYSH